MEGSVYATGRCLAANTGIAVDGARVHDTNHTGLLEIGPTEIACAVLPGEIRVISERALVKAFGGKRGGAHWRRRKADTDGANLPIILSAKNLQPFIDDELRAGLQERFVYKSTKGGAIPAHGLRAEMLPRVCDVYLKARDANALEPSQKDIGIAADILMRSLAQVGIIALVDEATGFQSSDRNAYRAILAKLIGQELAKWEKRFPQNFYRAIYRLKGWTFNEQSTRRPMIVAQITADIVYDRLGPGVIDELRDRNPVNESGRRQHKHHQWLTPDLGHPVLSRHLDRLIFLADASISWQDFYDRLAQVAPSQKHSLTFDFGKYSITPVGVGAIDSQPHS